MNCSRDSKIKGSKRCAEIKQLLSVTLLEVEKVEVALSRGAFRRLDKAAGVN